MYLERLNSHQGIHQVQETDKTTNNPPIDKLHVISQILPFVK